MKSCAMNAIADKEQSYWPTKKLPIDSIGGLIDSLWTLFSFEWKSKIKDKVAIGSSFNSLS